MKKKAMFRKLWIFLLTFVLVTGLASAAQAKLFSGGTGAEGDPFQISNANDLNLLAELVNKHEFGTVNGEFVNAVDGCRGIFFRQTEDIQLAGDFPMIGSNAYPFQGNYNGDGHMISGLEINTDKEYAGLFGSTARGTLENIILIQPRVESIHRFARVGALVGHQLATVKSCIVISPQLSAPGEIGRAGALFGYADSTGAIYDCYFYDFSKYGSGTRLFDPTSPYQVQRLYTLKKEDKVTATAEEFQPAVLGQTYYKEGTAVELGIEGGTEGRSVSYHVNHQVIPDYKNTFVLGEDDEFISDVIVGVESISHHKYAVKFHGNGSTGGNMENQEFVCGTAENLDTCKFTRELTVVYEYNGATGSNAQKNAKATASFDGWARTIDGPKVYNDGQRVMNLASDDGAVVDLYGKWTDGTVKLPTPRKYGYVFDAWCADPQLKDPVGNGGELYKPAQNGEKLYAKYGTKLAKVTEAPKACDLTSDGDAHELVTAGKAEGGTIYYALGVNDYTLPYSGDFEPQIPVGIHSGTYYVWYKAWGDETHLDSAPKCVKVVIKPSAAKEIDNTPVEPETVDTDGDGVPDTKIDGYTPEQKPATSDDIPDQVIPDKPSSNVPSSGSSESGQASTAGEPGGVIPRSSGAAGSLTPEEQAEKQKEASQAAQEFETQEQKAIEQAAEEKEQAQIALNAKLYVTNTGNKVTVRFGKAKGATEYEIYAKYCGTKKFKKVKTLKGTKANFTKLNGKKLNLTKNITVYVVAYNNGKELARTKDVHVALRNSKKYTNVKRLNLSFKNVTLNKGKSKQIKITPVYENASKKPLPVKGHRARYYYATTNKKVATAKNGKIKAVGKGKCFIYVYAMNGKAARVKVTVK